VVIVAINLLARECFTDGWKNSKVGAFAAARGYGFLRSRSSQIAGPISRNCRISADEIESEVRISDGTKQCKKGLRPNRTAFVPMTSVTSWTVGPHALERRSRNSLRGINPRAKYTDRATATCRRC
jgi:hypothetical protein